MTKEKLQNVLFEWNKEKKTKQTMLAYCKQCIASFTLFTFPPTVVSLQPSQWAKLSILQCKYAITSTVWRLGAPFSQLALVGLSPLGGAISQQAPLFFLPCYQSEFSTAYRSSMAPKADTSGICCVKGWPARRRGRRHCCCEPGWRTSGSPCTERAHGKHWSEGSLAQS